MNQITLKAKIDVREQFKISRMKEVIKPTRPHKHDGYYEIILLQQGAGFHTIDTSAYEVMPPLVHILKPRQVHCWDFSQIPKGYVLMFREEVLRPFPGAREKLYELPPEIRFNDSRDLMILFQQCYDAYCNKILQPDIYHAYLNLIVLKLFYVYADQPHSANSTATLLYAFKKVVDQRYHEYRQVSQYADLLHTSPAKLNDACKAVGKNAQSVIKERIVMEAKNLLLHTDKTVAEVGSDLQFSDASNFVKFFKSHTRLTPHQYRKMR